MPPRGRPGLLILLGTGARVLDEGGGAEPTGRPGEEKGSGSVDCLPHRLPILVGSDMRMRKWTGRSESIEREGVGVAREKESWWRWYWVDACCASLRGACLGRQRGQSGPDGACQIHD